MSEPLNKPEDIFAVEAAIDASAVLPAQLQPSKNVEIGELLRSAVDKNLPVESMEKLVSLYERMADRMAVGEFNTAFALFKRDCPEIRKVKKAKITTKEGIRFEYDFAPLEEICRVIDPVCAQHGFAYSWDSAIEDGKMAATCTLVHSGGHSRTSRFACPTESRSGMSEQQKHAGALSFAKRQSLTSVLGLCTVDPDIDGAGVETISEKEVADLTSLITEVGADLGRFLKFCGVDSLEEIRSADYSRAVKALEAKRK